MTVGAFTISTLRADGAVACLSLAGDLDLSTVAILQEASRLLMEDVPLIPLYTLAEIYGAARNVMWKARPDEKVLAAEMKIRS